MQSSVMAMTPVRPSLTMSATAEGGRRHGHTLGIVMFNRYLQLLAVSRQCAFLLIALLLLLHLLLARPEHVIGGGGRAGGLAATLRTEPPNMTITMPSTAAAANDPQLVSLPESVLDSPRVVARQRLRAPPDWRLQAHHASPAVSPLAQVATASAASGRTFSGRTVVAATALGAVGSAVAVRQLMKVPTDPYAGRAEGSQARIAIEPQAERVVRVLYHDRSGVPKLARLDETAFSAEAERLATELEQAVAAARRQLLDGAPQLDETFAECQGTIV